MNIKLTTEEQRNELLARLVFGISNLRHWQKEKHSEYDHDVNRAIEKWEVRMDELLENIGATGYQSLQELIDELNEQINISIDGDTLEKES